jgi:hypothetical protein
VSRNSKIGLTVLGLVVFGSVIYAGSQADQTTTTTTTTATVHRATTTLPSLTTTTRPTPTTTRTTRPRPTTTSAPRVLGKDALAQLWIALVRQESSNYSVLTFADVLSDNDLLDLLDQVCAIVDNGGDWSLAMIAFMNGYDPDGTAPDEEYFYAGYFFGAAEEACHQIAAGS